MENKNNILSSLNSYNVFIRNIENYNKKNKNFYIEGKILDYIQETKILNFLITINKTTEINTFNSDILLNLEFSDNSIPYVYIINDFINPTLNDGRNLFYCLSNKYDYIFHDNKLQGCEKIINEIISNIKNFLICLKDNIQINILVFYGEYTIGKVYQINNFLMNNNNLKFYKIFQVKGKSQGMKYIIITQLYFLLFEPIETDKSFAKLVRCDNLYENNFLINEFDYKQKKINNKKGCSLKIDDFDLEFIIIGENLKKSENGDDINQFKNELIKKKSETKFDKYKYVIINYIPLFVFDFKKIKYNDNNGVSKKDYKLYIKYFEELYNYYINLKEEKYQTKIKTILSDLNFFCVDLLSFPDINEEEVELYKIKIDYCNNNPSYFSSK